MIAYKFAVKSLLLMILCLGTITPMFAAEGDLDNTFDGDGILVTDNGSEEDTVTDLVVQPDGKIIAAVLRRQNSASPYQTYILRYNTNGTIDTAFGTNGRTDTSGSVRKVALTQDGKIVLAGNINVRFFYAARLNTKQVSIYFAT